MEYKSIEPTILYFGTPVALITTLDKDGNANIGPMSSVWALGWTLTLGLECASKTYQNLLQQRECVVNFPSPEMQPNVEKIASLTGAYPVPEYKQGRYQYSADKFNAGGFERLPAETVRPPRISGCGLQFEAVLKDAYEIIDDPKEAGPVAAVIVRVQRIHADKHLIVGGKHIDPMKWEPLIYNFRHYYALGEELGKTFKAEV